MPRQPKARRCKHDMDSNKLHRVEKAAGGAAGAVFGAVGLALKILATVLLIFLTTALLFACIFAFYVKTTLQDDLDVSLSDYSLSESSIIYYEDSNGEWQELATLSGSENRIWVDLEDIPDHLVKALVAIEDRRFYEHKGVDWFRTLAAITTMFSSSDDIFGGSTITQQLIKNLTGNNDVTVRRKLIEIFQALEFEQKYDKDEIITWYLNAVYFGEGSYGIYAAAKTYFDKEPSELTLAESAAIVGIVNLTTYYSPFYSEENNKNRQETILREMYEQGYINYDEYTSAVNEQLVFARSANEAGQQEIYSWYVETVIEDVKADLMEQKGISADAAEQLLYSGGYRIYTCYDPEIQADVDAVYQNLDALPKSYRPSEQQLQSAIVIMDPYTGEIVALAGGVGEKTANLITNRATQSERPPGSSFKPLSVYAPAIEAGLITQNTLVNDAPAGEITLSGNPNWYPNNADHTNRGIVTIRQAVMSSLNTVAAQVLDKLGVDASYSFLENNLGFTTLIEQDRNYSSLALGELTNGATVREMTQAFCTFINGGIFTESHVYTQVTDSSGSLVLENNIETHVAMKANTAYNVLDMLYGAATSGTGTEANFWSQPVAGKTGTSSYDWNRWFCGTTGYYTAAVWTGYDMPEQMYFYGNPAAQIWRSVMSAVHEGLEWKSLPSPSYVGGDTMIFGDLTSPSPSPSEEPEESTEPDTPVEPSEPVEPEQSTAPDSGTEDDDPGYYFEE